ncbi:MAG: putative DNA binding domain-containing protein [Bacteroidales bacterium]|nr:putative DNA binding domain-containing protein [Bacteroidales bacterium]
MSTDIREKIKGAEHASLEFKSAKAGFPKSFWETFSAFANTEGGMIVLGVAERQGRFVADGLTPQQIADLKKTFWDSAHNRDKVSATMLAERDVTEEEIDGNRVLAFRVPAAPYQVRPVYITTNPFGHTYMRNHEGDCHCTDEEIKEMISDSLIDRKNYDSDILPNYQMRDIDRESLEGYRRQFAFRHPDHPWTKVDDETFLIKIGAYKIDRANGREGFTRAGILMLGTNDAITDPACDPWFFVDYQELQNPGTSMRWTDRLWPDGTWEANIYQFFHRVYNKVSKALPVPFRLEGITRIDETSAHVALREGLVNMCVHANYALNAKIEVKWQGDTILMRNPGRMLITPDDFYEETKSVCRNPLLQKMFMLIGYGEKAGSGADYIMRGWKDNKWPKPQIKENLKYRSVDLVFRLSNNCIAMEDEVPYQPKSINRSSMVVGYDFDEDVAPSQESKAKPTEIQTSNPTDAPVIKPKVKFVQDQIVEFCREPRSMAEISKLTGMSSLYRLKKVYVDPLIGSRLQMTHPELPTHRDQKYISL